MSKIKSQAFVQVKIQLELTEIEAQALIAIAGYGSKSFLEVFYKFLGKHYLSPHEKGVVSLFETIRCEMKQHVFKAEQARNILKQKQTSNDHTNNLR